MRDTQLQHIAAQIRRRRTARAWTLDTAAPRLGISRRLLVQIEAGDANPSLSSLLAIAAGFEVPLVELLAAEDKTSIVVQHDNNAAPALWSGPHGGSGQLLVASAGLELWDWVLEPGEERRSEPHRDGAREALRVTAGTVMIQLGDDEPVILGRGQSAAFVAEREHRYANTGTRTARFTLAVHESG